MNPTKEEIYELYVKQNLGTVPTSKKLKIGRSKLTKLLKEYNIPIKKPGSIKKYFANDNFFSEWSKNMAYCLGFITADGHVWKNRPFLTIGISDRDKYVLEFIRDCISPDTLVRHTVRNKVQINIHSEQIHKDLSNLGIKNDKTFGLKIDFEIPEEYWGDYLRGIFDGDGCIWQTIFYKGGKEYYYSSIVSASRQFLEYIRNRLGFGRIGIVRKKYFELVFNQTLSLCLFDIIYKNQESFRMLRKYEKFLEINKTYFLWTKEEDAILLINLDKKKKELIQLLPNRTWQSIITRKNNKKREIRKNSIN